MAKRYSTSTVKPDGAIVPWLAADGPLAYSPENPPESNYCFQYSWLMPRVFRDKRHYYFGRPSSWSGRDIDSRIKPLVDFWGKARSGAVARVHVSNGGRYPGGFAAPIACYRYRAGWDKRDTYLLIQHGSYLAIDVDEQPLIEDGQLVLFRGLGKRPEFYWRTLERLSPNQKAILELYFDTHQKAFSDAEVSFQIAHAWVRRCETGFLRWEFSWTDVSNEVGFGTLRGSFPAWLESAYRQSFTLQQWTADRKFGPNYVRCATPLNNVRITSDFAGESEVNVIDPRRVEILTPRLGKSAFACEQRSARAD